VIDPVLTSDMDGLSGSFLFKGFDLKLNFAVKTGNFSPKNIDINGEEIVFEVESNPYRKGGAVIPLKELLKYLKPGNNELNIVL